MIQKDWIRKQLIELQEERDISIMWAIESGSRAWGFASQDSDFDVRFVYCADRDVYLSVFPTRETLDLPIEDDLDFVGWDLKKALLLMQKSNIALLEWLHSPIVYLELDSEISTLLKTYAVRSFSPKRGYYHYMSMASKKLEVLQSQDSRSLKTYFYVLRPMLCAQWILERGTFPPVESSLLFEAMLPTDAVRITVAELLQAKEAATEKDTCAPHIVLEAYLTATLQELRENQPEGKGEVIESEEWNTLFRTLLELCMEKKVCSAEEYVTSARVQDDT